MELIKLQFNEGFQQEIQNFKFCFLNIKLYLTVLQILNFNDSIKCKLNGFLKFKFKLFFEIQIQTV